MQFTEKHNYYIDKAKHLLIKPLPKDKINFIVIVSTGRTGTKFLADYYNHYAQNILAKHEPFPPVAYLNADFFKNRISFDQAEKTYLNKRKHIQKILHSKGINNYLESNSGLAFLLPIIKKQFPRYKIVHIIRDGRDWIRSVYSRKLQNDGTPTLNKRGEVWKFTAKDINDQYANNWDNMNMIEQLSWMWKVRNEFILNYIRDDERAISIRFEDIFNPDDNYKIFDKLIHFINDDTNIKLNLEDPLIPVKKKINKTNKFLLPPYMEWNESDKESFNNIAGDLMEEYNYF